MRFGKEVLCSVFVMWWYNMEKVHVNVIRPEPVEVD
jgi:hypothetical protein